MNLSLFDFEYPRELVAQYPSARRGDSRLLIAHRKAGEIHHTAFEKIIDFLGADDCLIVNQTRVIPARFFGTKASGGKVEIILLSELERGVWRCLGRGAKSLKKDSKVFFDEIEATVLEIDRDGILTIRLFFEGDFEKILMKYGHWPLPSYIRRRDEAIDSERYQTVFSEMASMKKGAVAAPTAGLHWDKGLIERLQEKGISVVPITLHVGYGTFVPIREENIKNHKMHEEFFEISQDAARRINDAKRVIAIGTTTVRALESSYLNGKVVPRAGWTDLFIYPGYHFQVIDALQTNFHQPKSSLFVMVSAFAGHSFISRCYKEAIEQKYRLFSYGDTMLIL